MKNRVFFFSFRKKPEGKTGGPAGVNIRLYEANKKYKMFDNVYFIYNDCVMDKDGNVVYLKNWRGIKAGLFNMKPMADYFVELHEKFEFTVDDVYIFQEVESAYVMGELFGGDMKRTLLCYHQQGSLYYEMIASGNEENEKVERYLLEVMKKVFRRISVLAFPSVGAKNALIETLPEIKSYIENKTVAIMYNGCDCDTSKEVISNDAKELIGYLKNYDGLKFLSVAALNHAKGVERLPEILKAIKGAGIEFLWTIIGSGAMEEMLEKEIIKYGLEDNIVWIRERMPNSDIMKIFEISDIYIMGHRFSIFDYAIIEAMQLGNIPVLTKVGGNLEVILDDNGFLIEDIAADGEKLVEWLENIDMKLMKEKNIKIARENFSEKTFLEYYKAAADILSE